MATLEGTHVSGSVRPNLLFDAMPHVLRMRAGLANNFVDVVQRETDQLREISVKPEIKDDGFIELVPLTESAARDTARIESLISARDRARREKKFSEADRIRDELAKMGVVLHDKKDGTTTWEVAR